MININPNDVYPAQYYVLRSELNKVSYIRSLILEKGIDIFSLDGYLKVWTDENDASVVDILPPVIEESMTRTGDKVPIVCDGLHRVYLARKLESKINLIYVKDIPEEYPYYAYPNKNGWDDVVEIDSLPHGYIKKDYRITSHRTLFRDFNSAFDNVGRRKFGESFVFHSNSQS